MVRYLSIDVLRGLAVLLMIQVHFVDNLSSRVNAYALHYDISTGLGMIPAPLFTFVSGASYALWLRKQGEMRRSELEITKVTMRRGLFLFGAGIAFNVLIWLPEDTFNWDILTLIGTSLILLAFARKLPPGVLATMCLMILILSPLLRAASDYSAYWDDDTYSYDLNLTEVFLGFISNAYFPVFPWIVFPFVGFLVGEMAFPRPGRPEPVIRWVVGVGLGFLCLALLCFVVRERMPSMFSKHYLNGYTIFPATTEFIFGTLGFSILCLVCLRRWLDQNPKITGTGRILTFFRLYGKYALTVYIIHHMVHLWPLWIYGTWKEDDPTYYWRDAVSTPSALGLALAFIVVCYFLLIFLDRHGRYGFEYFMRWLCE